jgi:hypothetical protein
VHPHAVDATLVRPPHVHARASVCACTRQSPTPCGDSTSRATTAPPASSGSCVSPTDVGAGRTWSDPRSVSSSCATPTSHRRDGPPPWLAPGCWTCGRTASGWSSCVRRRVSTGRTEWRRSRCGSTIPTTRCTARSVSVCRWVSTSSGRPTARARRARCTGSCSSPPSASSSTPPGCCATRRPLTRPGRGSCRRNRSRRWPRC